MTGCAGGGAEPPAGVALLAARPAMRRCVRGGLWRLDGPSDPRRCSGPALRPKRNAPWVAAVPVLAVGNQRSAALPTGGRRCESRAGWRVCVLWRACPHLAAWATPPQTCWTCARAAAWYCRRRRCTGCRSRRRCPAASSARARRATRAASCAAAARAAAAARRLRSGARARLPRQGVLWPHAQWIARCILGRRPRRQVWTRRTRGGCRCGVWRVACAGPRRAPRWGSSPGRLGGWWGCGWAARPLVSLGATPLDESMLGGTGSGTPGCGCTRFCTASWSCVRAAHAAQCGGEEQSHAGGELLPGLCGATALAPRGARGRKSPSQHHGPAVMLCIVPCLKHACCCCCSPLLAPCSPVACPSPRRSCLRCWSSLLDLRRCPCRAGRARGLAPRAAP